MLPYRDSRITIIALVVFFVLVAVYAYFEARGLLFGPRINVPSTALETHERFILIKGSAERISSLSMNGEQIEVTEDGAFSEPYLLSPGLNRVALDAEDKYGRTRHEVLQIVYTPDESSAETVNTSPTTETGSSTAATSTP